MGNCLFIILEIIMVNTSLYIIFALVLDYIPGFTLMLYFIYLTIFCTGQESETNTSLCFFVPNSVSDTHQNILTTENILSTVNSQTPGLK